MGGKEILKPIPMSHERRLWVSEAALLIFANERTTFEPDPNAAIKRAEELYDALVEKDYL